MKMFNLVAFVAILGCGCGSVVYESTNNDMDSTEITPNFNDMSSTTGDLSTNVQVIPCNGSVMIDNSNKHINIEVLPPMSPRSLNSSCDKVFPVYFNGLLRLSNSKTLQLDITYKIKAYSVLMQNGAMADGGIYADELKIGFHTQSETLFPIATISGFDIVNDINETKHLIITYDIPVNNIKDADGLYFDFYNYYYRTNGYTLPGLLFSEKSTITINKINVFQ